MASNKAAEEPMTVSEFMMRASRSGRVWSPTFAGLLDFVAFLGTIDPPIVWARAEAIDLLMPAIEASVIYCGHTVEGLPPDMVILTKGLALGEGHTISWHESEVIVCKVIGFSELGR